MSDTAGGALGALLPESFLSLQTTDNVSTVAERGESVDTSPIGTSGLLREAFIESDFWTGGENYPPIIRHNLGEWEDVSPGVCVECSVR